mmetsp:Transcript_534/g.1270  ORF Transcript_534/g.1270 Transcript_534/m.1270 type:complete len:275 (-) Transcript_534:366-1190(-)
MNFEDPIIGMHHNHDMHINMHMHEDTPSEMMEMIKNDAGDSLDSNIFCDDKGMGGMVMYMEGFHWTLLTEENKKNARSCLNFYFESWKLDTRPKFFAAMLCVVFLGIVTEGIGRWKHEVFQQEKILRHQQGRRQRLRQLHWMHTCLQGLSVLLAYLLMLVVMTYSLELLCCVILGLMIGYFVFGGEYFRHGGGTLCCNFLNQDDTNSSSNNNNEGRDDSLTENLLPSTSISIGGNNEDNDNNNNTDTLLGNDGYSCCNDTGVVTASSRNEEDGI